MSAGVHNILIEQGATFQLTLTMRDETGTPINLTGQTFQGWLKQSFTEVAAIAEFDFSLQDQSDPLTVGKVVVSLDAITTAALPAQGKGTVRTLTKMVYDIESYDGDGYIVRWLQGEASISPEVTTV